MEYWEAKRLRADREALCGLHGGRSSRRRLAATISLVVSVLTLLSGIVFFPSSASAAPLYTSVIRNIETNTCVDLPNTGAVNYNTPLSLHRCIRSRHDNQIWNTWNHSRSDPYISHPDGYFQVRNWDFAANFPYGRLCMGIADDGNRVIVEGCDSYDNTQRWYWYNTRIGNLTERWLRNRGTGMNRNAADPYDLCLDVHTSSPLRDKPLTVWRCSVIDEHNWVSEEI